MRQSITLAVALATACGVVHAAPISGNGLLGDYTGDFSYNAGTQTVSVSLTNSLTTLPGGRITGFAFNLPTGVTVSGYSALGAAGTTFTLLGGPSFNNSVSVNPYGDADTGAALGGSWLGGGSPAGGVAVGQSGTWTFQLSGSGLGALTETDFFNLLTTGNGSGQNRVPFLVRFRGFDNGGSDKVPGGFGDPPVDPTGDPEVVPEPATMVTLGILGGMGLMAYSLRRKKA